MKRILQFLIGWVMLLATRLSIGWHGVSVRVHRRYYGMFFTGGWPFRSLPVIAGGSDAISTAGVYLETGDGVSPETFTEVAEVFSFGGPNEDSEEIDVTHLRSPGRRREYIQSYLDAGELPINMNWVTGDAAQEALIAEYDTGTINNRRLNFPDGSVLTFQAYVKSRSTPAAVGEKLVRNVTLRITGDVSWSFA